MEIFKTILIGAGIFIGVMIVFGPLALLILLGDGLTYNEENKLYRFYFNTWPKIIIGIFLTAFMVSMFYVIGQEIK